MRAWLDGDLLDDATQGAVSVTDHGFTLFYPPTADAAEPIPAAAMSVASLHLPDRAVIFQKGLRTDFFSVIHMVPVTETSCRVEWMTRQPGDKPWVEWTPEEPRTLEQDRVLQESAQLNYSRAGSDFERHVPADYATLLVRKIMAIARTGRWPEDRGTLVQRIRYAENEVNYCPRCQTDGKMLADRSLSRLLGSDWPRTVEDWEEEHPTPPAAPPPPASEKPPR